MAIGGCRKCYNCSNGCFKKFSTGEVICSSDFNSYAEYHHVADSLGADVNWGGPNTFGTFSEKVCNQKDLEEYESKPGISCSPINK